MADISRTKESVKKAYPHSRTWPAKVDKMTDGQVIAIFLKLRRQGKA
jgi:hypothetical protein